MGIEIIEIIEAKHRTKKIMTCLQTKYKKNLERTFSSSQGKITGDGNFIMGSWGTTGPFLVN